jgi:hypothetical protein
MQKLKYKKSGLCRYELTQDFVIRTPIVLYRPIKTKFISLMDGILSVSIGYVWNGCSGPTYDCDKSRVPCLVHDLFYNLMDDYLLPTSYRREVDYLLYIMLLENGFSRIRAAYYYAAVRIFGKYCVPRIIHAVIRKLKSRR